MQRRVSAEWVTRVSLTIANKPERWGGKKKPRRCRVIIDTLECAGGLAVAADERRTTCLAPLPAAPRGTQPGSSGPHGVHPNNRPFIVRQCLSEETCVETMSVRCTCCGCGACVYEIIGLLEIWSTHSGLRPPPLPTSVGL